MYRLTVIAGPSNAQPARGSSFVVQDGQHSIGRNSQNEIVLQSGNVSKKHCVLVASNGQLIVRDQGSANGTFVNGKLASERVVESGDRISVGEFVFEISQSSSLPAVQNSNVLQFPAMHSGGVPLPSHGIPASSEVHAEVMPTDPIGKAKFFFEKFVMPYFYGMNERYEWRFVSVFLLFVFMCLNLFVSVSPLVDSHERALTREIAKRANVMAREIADKNTAALAAKQESKTDIGILDRAEAVRTAYLIDLESRIIAPATKANQYFTVGPEATFAVRARALFVNGRESGIVEKIDATTVVAVEPVKVLNPQLGKNQVVALAVVALDTTLANPGAGEMSLVYAYTLILTGMIGFVIFYILYRVTLKPLEIMNQRIDQALKGEPVEMKSPVYFEELDSLWEIVDGALKRVPKGEDASGGLGSGFGGGGSPEEFTGPLRALSQTSSQGMAVLDDERKIVHLNSIFEEATGIRLESSEGQPLAQVSRDQAFSVFVQDLFDRAMPGTEGVTEEFEFSGMAYKIHCVAFGSMGAPKCYVMTLMRNDG